MDRMKLSCDPDQNEIYLIARVFSLGTGGMGLRLYVDPASLQDQGDLKFRADKYAVTPTC
jgi:hypothetical protein